MIASKTLVENDFWRKVITQAVARLHRKGQAVPWKGPGKSMIGKMLADLFSHLGLAV